MKTIKQFGLFVLITATILMIMPSTSFGFTSTSGWLDCPFGEHNDHYPGKCRRYIDTDHDGICDHSEAPPEIRGYTYPDTGIFLLLKIETSTIWNAQFSNGKLVAYSSISTDVPPFIDPTVNRTMVPLRFVAENLNLKVDWNNKTREIVITSSIENIKIIIHMPISEAQQHGPYLVYPGSPIVELYQNGNISKLNLTNLNGKNMGIPFIYQSRTFVPLRFVSEIFGANIQWYPDTRSITIVRGEQ
ncbi:copper amine oxidase N-terminal domain-containing protein [Zhurongbacter thermophilus]